MGIIRCNRQLHFYDEKKYDSCPYCEQQKKRVENNAIQEQKTVAMQPDEIPEVNEFIWREQKEKIEANDYGRTIGYYSPVRGNDYVTGWLVCVAGNEKGRDYRLHHGFNRVGRSMDMDVALLEDQSITRNTHCSIVYDRKSNRFYVLPGVGTFTYLNQELLEEQSLLENGDRIQIGDSIFEFIAYCREGHTWEEEK